MFGTGGLLIQTQSTITVQIDETEQHRREIVAHVRVILQNPGCQKWTVWESRSAIVWTSSPVKTRSTIDTSYFELVRDPLLSTLATALLTSRFEADYSDHTPSFPSATHPATLLSSRAQFSKKREVWRILKWMVTVATKTAALHVDRNVLLKAGFVRISTRLPQRVHLSIQSLLNESKLLTVEYGNCSGTKSRLPNCDISFSVVQQPECFLCCLIVQYCIKLFRQQRRSTDF